jgi:hypothetical protein
VAKAEEYLAAAAESLEARRLIAATSLAIHSAINAADPVTGSRLGTRASLFHSDAPPTWTAEAIEPNTADHEPRGTAACLLAIAIAGHPALRRQDKQAGTLRLGRRDQMRPLHVSRETAWREADELKAVITLSTN